MIKKYLEFINESNTYQHSVNVFHGSKHKFDMFNFNNLGKDLHILSFIGPHFSESDEVSEDFAGPPDFMLYEVQLGYNKCLEIKESELVKNMYKFGFDKGYITRDKFSLDLPYRYINSKHIDKKETEKTALECKKMLIEKGYDCIKYVNEIESPEIERYDWIAFNPEQIKIIGSWSSKPEIK